MKSGLHEPIFLAKFKKQAKENIPQSKPKHSKESIEYDLMLFQESLQLQNDQSSLSTIQARQSRQPLGDASSNFNKTMPYRMSSTDRNYCKEESGQLLGSTGPVMTRNEFNKNFRQLKSLHRTTASYKPSLSGKSQSRSQITKNTQVVNQKTDNNCIKKPKMEVLYEQRIQLMQKSYDNKIQQLISENQRLVDLVKVLKNASQIQEQEKQCIVKRMDLVEEQMKALVIDNIELQEMQAQLVKLEPQKEDFSVQTQNKFYEHCEKQTQTQEVNFVPAPISEPRSEIEMSNQNWCVKAKTLKGQLQWYKIHCTNLSTQARVALDNKQIQWGQKYDKLQKQFEQITHKYNSKCAEVKDKDQLLNKFITKK